MSETPSIGSDAARRSTDGDSTAPSGVDDLDLALGDSLEVQLIAQRARMRMFGDAGATTRVGRYVLVDRLGAGGMGVVYSAYDATLDRKVAIKFIHRHLAERPSTRERFVREARAMARLSHPNVVQIHDAGDDDGRLFLALEFVTGGTLRAYLHEHRDALGWRDVVAMFRHAALGLAAAHDVGIVHRDFKPDNVLCPAQGGIKVADFGLAGISADGVTVDPSIRVHDDGHGVTASDREDEPAAVGTLPYMAPEQQSGRSDARADQFAFCVSLFEALAGVHPFDGGTPLLKAVSIAAGRRGPAVLTQVPRSLRDAIERGLSVEPDARWPNLRALVDAIDRATAPRSRVAWVLSGGIAIATAIGVVRAPARAAVDPCSDVSEVATALANERPAALVQWATSWIDARQGGCRAHQGGELSDALFDRRNVCLDGALAAVQTRHALAGADAAAATVEIDEIDRCTDAVRLSAGPIPAGSGPARDTWIALREQIARAEDAIDRGDVGAVDAIVGGLVAEAQSVEDARLVDDLAAHGEWLRGRAARARGDLEASAVSLAAAGAQADRAGDDELRARALVEAVWVTGVELLRADEARKLATLAEGAIARAGVHARLAASLHEGLGMTAMYQGALDDATAHLGRALATSTSPRNRTTLHANLASVALRRGDAVAAVDSLQRALAEIDDPAADASLRDPAARSGVLNNLGYAQLAAGRPDAALATHQQSLALREAAFGGDSLEVANALGGIGLAQLELGRVADARAALERALAIRVAHGGRPEDLAEVQFGLARALAPADPRTVELATAALAAYRDPALRDAFAREAMAVVAWLTARGITPAHPPSPSHSPGRGHP